MEYNVVFIPVNELKPYKNNAKKHPQEQIDRIAQSIRQFGFRQNLVVDEDNCVIIGHGRLLAAKQLGISQVPCVRVEDLSEEEIKALRLADNMVAESEWDKALLMNELGEIQDIDMSDFGFDLEMPEPMDLDDVDTGTEKPAKDAQVLKCPKCGFAFEMR